MTLRRLFAPLSAFALFIGSATALHADAPKNGTYTEDGKTYRFIRQDDKTTPPAPQPAPAPKPQPAPQPTPAPKPQPAPQPALLTVSPVAFDFEVTPAYSGKTPKGDPAVMFKATVKVDNAKGKAFQYIVTLTDKDGKAILGSNGMPFLLIGNIQPEVDQGEYMIEFYIDRSPLMTIYGAGAKEFHFEANVSDVTGITNFNDPKQVAKIKVIGTSVELFHRKIPAEGEILVIQPPLPTDSLND